MVYNDFYLLFVDVVVEILNKKIKVEIKYRYISTYFKSRQKFTFK